MGSDETAKAGSPKCAYVYCGVHEIKKSLLSDEMMVHIIMFILQLTLVNQFPTNTLHSAMDYSCDDQK